MPINYSNRTIPERRVYRAEDLQAINRTQHTSPVDVDGLKLVSLIDADGKHPAFVVEV